MSLFHTFSLLLILLSVDLKAQTYFSDDFEGTWSMDNTLIHLSENNAAQIINIVVVVGC